MILYAYRVIVGLIDFPWFEMYENNEDEGLKLRSKYNHRAPPYVRRKRHSSFFYKGPQLFNLIPTELRDVQEITRIREDPTQDDVDEFKKVLDQFLVNIPDEPSVPERQRVAATNSLICQIPLYRRQQRQMR